MKIKLMIPLPALVFALQAVQAQIPIYQQPNKSLKQFDGDVLMYLKYNFLDIKEKFSGKSLTYLLDSIEPKFAEYLPSVSHLRGVSGVSFFFLNDSSKAAKRPALRISFQNLLMPADSAFKLWKNDKKQWTVNERNFYGKAIVKDISIDGLLKDDVPPTIK